MDKKHLLSLIAPQQPKTAITKLNTETAIATLTPEKIQNKIIFICYSLEVLTSFKRMTKNIFVMFCQINFE